MIERSGMIVSHPQMEDIQDVFALICLCERNEYGEPDADFEELAQDWEDIDLAVDAWLTRDPSGTLVGYAAVLPFGESRRLDFFLHPRFLAGEGALDFLSYPFNRLTEINNSSKAPLSVVSFIAAVNRRNQQLLEERSFRKERHHFQMRIDIRSAPPQPEWPEGISFSAYQPADDMDLPEIYDLIRTAFARPGRNPQPFEEWRNAMMRPEIFEPTLWILARREKRIVGVSLCYAYPGLGWVRQLAVADDWRRKGLGMALLLHSFGVFCQRGLPEVGLGVAADNENARALYERAGMSVRREYLEYRKDFLPEETRQGPAAAAD